MRQELAFNYFNEGDTVYFNMGRLYMLEKSTGITYGTMLNGLAVENGLMSSPILSIPFVAKALVIGMEHIYHRKSEQWYLEQIDTAIENGSNFMEMASTLLNAIILAGTNNIPDDVTRDNDTKN